MQKIQNLKYYVNTEIGLVQDVESADARYESIKEEILRMAATLKASRVGVES